MNQAVKNTVDNGSICILNAPQEQEMLSRNYLTNAEFYGTCAHTAEIIDKYSLAIDEAFGVLSKATKANDVNQRLRGPVAHTGFSRLT